MYTRHQTPVAALLAAALLAGLLTGCASTPPYQGLSSQELFDTGAREFEEEDWDEAVKVFERLIFADPTFDRLVEARMYVARAYFNRDEYLTAVAEFSRILDRHPGHPLAREASLGVCQAYAALSPHVQRDQTYTIQAYNACENTLADFPGTPVAAEARVLRDQMWEKMAEKEFIAGDFYFRRKMYNSAILYFDTVVERYPRTEAAARALLHLHRSYVGLGWNREAEEAKARLLREYPDSAAAREIGGEGVAPSARGGGGEKSPGGGGGSPSGAGGGG